MLKFIFLSLAIAVLGGAMIGAVVAYINNNWRY